MNLRSTGSKGHPKNHCHGFTAVGVVELQLCIDCRSQGFAQLLRGGMFRIGDAWARCLNREPHRTRMPVITEQLVVTINLFGLNGTNPDWVLSLRIFFDIKARCLIRSRSFKKRQAHQLPRISSLANLVTNMNILVPRPAFFSSNPTLTAELTTGETEKCPRRRMLCVVIMCGCHWVGAF